MHAPIVTVKDGRLHLNGSLVFNTVRALEKEVGSALSALDFWFIDLSGVERCDSSGLALLIHWINYAKANNKTIEFTNLPPQLRKIAAVCGVERFLDVGDNRRPAEQKNS